MEDYDDATATDATLTDAELRVLRWIRVGRTNREIGEILCRSEFTIKTQVQRMLAKTGLDNRLQLAMLALARPPRDEDLLSTSIDSHERDWLRSPRGSKII